MKSKRLLLMLLVALLAPWAAQAQEELTVYEGTNTNSYVPAYMGYFDDFTRSQFVIPAEDLDEMNGGTISSIKFYTTNSNVPYTSVSTVDVYLLEVDYTSISAFEPKTNDAIVYQGTLNIVTEGDGGSLTIEFSTPYTYNGGNLLVAIENTTDAGYKFIYFYGQNVTTGASGAGSNSSSLSGVTFTQRNFIPKTTFTYEAASTGCDGLETLTLNGDPEAHNATLAWTGGSGTYNIEYKKTTDSEWTLRMANYAGYGIMLVELDAETAYQARVQSVCDGDLLSNWKTVSFTTPVVCPKPTGLDVTLTLGNGTIADLSWTENGEATEWQICVDGDETNLITATTNPYQLTGLTAETAHTAKVRAYCDATDQSEWSNEVTFTPTNAYSITVNDGTTTNGYVPIYGYYCDASIVSQFIMPAEGLAAMQWGTINKLTFYAAADKDWGEAQFEVYMTEVDYTTFPSTTLVDWTTMDKVMNAASLGISGKQMVVNLDAPYQYTGGNLLIGIKQTDSGEYSSCSWYGVTATGASLGGNNYGSQQNFLPKTTFEFTPGEEPDCYMPTGLAVSYTGGTEATISWTSEATAWNIDVNGTVTGITENPYTLTDLELATNYEVKVQADCGDSQSDWTNAVSFTTDLCMPENQCEISYSFTDQYDDSWNNASMNIVDAATGSVLYQLTMPNEEGPYTGSFAVCDGRDIQFVWVSGSYPSECGYTFTDINGETILEKATATTAPSAGVVLTYTVSCTVTNCKKPTNFAASEVGPRSAKLSWTENGEATAWIVAYKEATATDFTEVNASTNPFVLEGLTTETAYTVKVKPECDVEKWSDEISFTTTEACPAPTGLVASNITAHTADLAWTGFSESYTVQYRTAAYMDGIEEGFGTSPTGWTMYTGLVDNVMAGTATLESATSGWSFDTNNGVFDNHARTNIYGASWDKWLVTPSIEVSGHLSFDLALTAYGGTLAAPQTTGTDDRFIVLVSTDEKATWTILREWNNSGSDYVYNDITCSATGESVTIDLSSYMGQTVYIAFYGESTASNADNNLHIDNVTCGTPVPAGAWQDAVVEGTTANLSGLLAETKYEATVQGDCGTDGTSAVVSTTFTTDIACPAPTALSYANVKSTSVDLSWTTGGAEDWIVAYKKDGDTEFTEKQVSTAQVTISGTTVTYTLTALLEETAYTVKVADNCEVSVAGDGQSAWTAETSFTTMAACSVANVVVSNVTHYTATVSWDGESASDFTVKYRVPAGNNGSVLNENFNSLTSGIPTGWDNSEGTTTTDSYKWNYYATGYDGAGLRFNSYNNSSNLTNFLKTPVLNLPAGAAIQLSFWWKNPTGGDFSVYISTDGGATYTTELATGLTSQTEWVEKVIELNEYAGEENVVIVFKGTSNYGYGDAYIYLDNVIVGEVVPAGEWQTVSATASPANIEGLEAGTKYDLTVVPNCDEMLASDIQQFTTLADNVKIFVTEGDWNEAGNWMDGLTPTLNDNAQLQANATITGLATAGNVTIASGKTLTIADGGQLQHNNTSTIAATVKKNVTGYGADNANTNNGYVLLAPPFGKSIYQNNSDGTGLRNGTYDLYSWARTTDLEWTNYGSSNSSYLYMSRGTGYLYANQEDTEITFTGSIYGSGSSYSASVSYTAPTAGTTGFSDWNLLGNPFVCNAYLVNAATNGTALAYYKMNADGNGFETVATAEPIAPMEGVFYQATESGSVYFTREMPATSTQPGTLNINLAQAVTTRGEKGSTDNAIIRFGQGNTLEKFSFNANSAKVFLTQDGKDYAVVNAEGNTGEIPVSFKATENGSYTLSFSNSEVTFSYLHLIDNMTGADVDLLANPTYSFDARTTDYESRFRLVFATGSSVDGDSFGFINGMGNLTIFGIEGEATLQVIDVTGRMLSSETFSGSYERKLNAAPGVYMLRLIQGNDVKVQKMVVR